MKTINFTVLMSLLIFSSCGFSDLKNITPPSCTTSTVPQQITLDWTTDAPSYYEVNSANQQTPCTMAPFYDDNAGTLNAPPFATTYNYGNLASAIPSSGLIPSSPTDKTNANQNALGIPLSSANYLCQITVQSEESGQDNCVYNGQGSNNPVFTQGWSTPGYFQSPQMYEFTSATSSNTQNNLNNEIIIDYFDVYSQCSAVTERPYFAGVAQVAVPVGAGANTIPAVVIAMANQIPFKP